MTLTESQLRQHLSYNCDTGQFHWNRSGKLAGWVDRSVGYVRVSIRNRTYWAHRLAWLYVHGDWPPEEIDHKDRDGTNNAIANLRLATRSENLGNTRRHHDNQTGFKGVMLHKKSGLYLARIMVRGERILLGYHRTPSLAHAAYLEGARRYFGAFARGS